MSRGPRFPRDTKPAEQRVDMKRFATAVRDGVTVRNLALRFELHFTTAARLRKQVLATAKIERTP